jgi:hypothetical protein
MRLYANLCNLNMSGKLIQTTVDASTLRKLDALAKARGHKRASYLRHLVEMHVQALTPELSKITRATSPLDYLDEPSDAPVNILATRKQLRKRRG